MLVDILALRVGIQAPDGVSVPCAEFAGLSLVIRFTPKYQLLLVIAR